MAMHCSPVVLLLWALCVTAFPYTWEDDRESAKDWLESARIQKSISRNKTREQRPTFVRHLEPKFGQDNPEQDNIQESTPNMDIFRNGQPPKFVRHLDPGILKVNQINRGIKRVAQYSPVTQGFIWKKTDLTYRIENYGVNLSPDDVVSAIERAFKVWSDVTPLTFIRIYSKADIEMKFVTGDHDDNNPFDPNTEYIAHAFQPGPHIGGDVHFNDAKSLTKTAELYNLFLVAAHEIGHALGLQHSDGPIDLMNPHYPTTDPKGYRLPQNDIDAIQRLYGPSPHNPFAKGPSACYPDQDYDAVTTLRGDMFFFTERYVLRKFYHSGEVIMDFIQTYWKFLPFDIDAAYEDPNSDTMTVFKGPKYWEFGSDLNLKYKGSIYNLRFPKGVGSIDAAVFVPDVEKAYFFAGEQYWRYDKKNNAMDKGFPRPIPKDFPGVGPQVTAAVYTEGKLYLFDSNALHEVSMNAKGQVVGHINQFPKDYWTRC